VTKILLVEDDNSLREIYEARLAAEGYTIVSAKDGEEALAVAAKEKPELVISDVMMPKISGFEMLDIMRNTDGLKTVKVIMLTALGQSEDKTRADALGADRYLVKSQVTLEDIVNAAGELLNETTPAATPTPAPAAHINVTPPEATPPAVAEPIVVTPPPSIEPVAVVPAPAPVPVPTPAPAPAPAPAAEEPVAPQAEPAVVETPAPIAAPVAAPTAAPEVIKPVTPAPNQTDPVVATPAPIEVTPEPDTEPTSAASTDATSADITPAREPSTLAEEEAFMQAQIDQFVKDSPDKTASDSDQLIAAAGNVIVGAPASTEATSAETAIQAPVVEDATSNAGSSNSVHKKVIQPINDINAKPDINALLAIEEAKEAASKSTDPAADASKTI
jgi:CheY-like chemotaxis protein